ncbi:MAG: hypothetical protein ACRCWJ_05975 [Casimicrobium sp.]
MSYDIQLVDAVTGETLELDAPHQMRGGTYAVGGTTQAHLNVTFNYAPHFGRVFDTLSEPHAKAPEWLKNGWPIAGLRTIYGLTGTESLAVLDKAIGLLADDVDRDYWKPTEGNAKRALLQLRALAEMRPDGIWTGD